MHTCPSCNGQTTVLNDGVCPRCKRRNDGHRLTRTDWCILNLNRRT